MAYENELLKIILPEVLEETTNGALITPEYPPELLEALEGKIRKILENNPWLFWGLVTRAHNLVCEQLKLPKEVNPYAPLPIPLDREFINTLIDKWKA